MPVDMSVLNNLKNPEPIDWANYKAPGESTYVRPPQPFDKEGKRVVFEGVLPDSKGITYKANNDHQLVVSVDPISLKGSEYKIRFTSISGKQFTRDNGTTSSFLANFVKAVDKNARPQTWQDYIKLIDTFARRSFKFTADWEAYDKQTGSTVCKGWKNFPEDPQKPGERLPWVEVDEGNAKRRVFANLKVSNYIAVK